MVYFSIFSSKTSINFIIRFLYFPKLNPYLNPSEQIPTFDMTEYRARLENYVLLPNIKDKIFVGKYFLKKLVRNLDGCHQIERFHVGNDFVFETIQGYVLILRS